MFGTAELGYGDGDESTILSFGDDEDDKHITTYFRKIIDVETSEAGTVNGVIQLRRDDGAVVYFNGEELFRDNMPSGEIDFETLASDAMTGVGESSWTTHTVSMELVTGANVLAVEIHQISPTSSDISFDLELTLTMAVEEIQTTENPLALELGGDAGYFARYQPTGACTLPETIAADLTLTADCSPYLATGTSVILESATLAIEPGVEIWFPSDAQLIVQGQLLAQGTTEAPIAFRLNPDYEAPWGNIQFDQSFSPNIIRHALVEGASKGEHPVHDRAAIAAWFSSLTLDHITMISNASNPVYAEYSEIQLLNSTLHSDVTGDLINVRHGSALIDSCLFVGNDAPDTDAIDYDVVSDGIIRNSIIHSFRGFNSDGIDLGEGSQNILIEGGLIHHCTDKGISIGQSSNAVIQNMTITNCALGVALKDLGAATVDHSTFYGNQYALSVYEKNPGMGGADILVQNSLLSNSSHSPLFQDSLSTALVFDVLYDTDTLPFEGVAMANPLFAYPDGFDFTLLEGSPAIGAGLDGADYGAPLVWSVAQRDVAIVEIGYAGIEDPNREWIKLRNEGEQEINLQGYALEDAVSWHCNSPLWLDPGEAVWITKDAAFFLESFEQVRQWDAGQLANEGERIILKDAAGIVVDFVRYAPDAPWPVPAAGSEALVRTDPLADNHFASSWMLAEVNEVTSAPPVEHQWQVYPNPVRSSLHMHFAWMPDEPVRGQWFNASGQCLEDWTWQPTSNEMVLDVSEFATGLYVLRVNGQSLLVQVL
jgi:hypothetical protein